MRFLADESCDFAVVRALREDGYEVTAVAEISPRLEDSAVLGLAREGSSILLTEDKDFGQLVFADHRSTGGVIFLRIARMARNATVAKVRDLVKQRGEDLRGRFVVVEPGRVRIGPKT